MEWDNKDCKDNRVVDNGGWCDIDQIPDQFPRRSGVYVFVNSTHHVKYVGKAGAGRLRDEAIDARDQRGKGLRATLAGWLATNSNANARSLESALIAKYNPPNNYTDS